MLSRIPESAMCVQRFDDSLNSAIHITYRNSLRSSSMREPRDPLLKVVLQYVIQRHSDTSMVVCKRHRQGILQLPPTKGAQVDIGFVKSAHAFRKPAHLFKINNDPSAGSPTETLLRLLLPLNDQV